MSGFHLSNVNISNFSEDSENIIAAVGTNSRTRGRAEYNISKIISHDSYHHISHANDIALLLTAMEIIHTDEVQAIALATRNTKPGAKCLLSGWGFVNVSTTIVIF